MPRILVVDDEDAICSLLAAVFANAGYDVSTAADAAHAIALFRSQPFDVMLSDVNMPAVDGHELVRWVARYRPGVECILMTAIDIDCDDCPVTTRCTLLRKPFQPQAAVALVSHVLHRTAD